MHYNNNNQQNNPEQPPTQMFLFSIYLLSLPILIITQCCIKFQATKCIECPPGMHLYRHNCIFDIPHCLDYQNGFDCAQCQLGFVYSQVVGNCVGSGGVDVDVSVNFSNNKYIEFKNKPDISYHRLKLSDSPQTAKLIQKLTNLTKTKFKNLASQISPISIHQFQDSTSQQTYIQIVNEEKLGFLFVVFLFENKDGGMSQDTGKLVEYQDQSVQVVYYRLVRLADGEKFVDSDSETNAKIQLYIANTDKYKDYPILDIFQQKTPQTPSNPKYRILLDSPHQGILQLNIEAQALSKLQPVSLIKSTAYYNSTNITNQILSLIYRVTINQSLYSYFQRNNVEILEVVEYTYKDYKEFIVYYEIGQKLEAKVTDKMISQNETCQEFSDDQYIEEDDQLVQDIELIDEKLLLDDGPVQDTIDNTSDLLEDHSSDISVSNNSNEISYHTQSFTFTKSTITDTLKIKTLPEQLLLKKQNQPYNLNCTQPTSIIIDIQDPPLQLIAYNQQEMDNFMNESMYAYIKRLIKCTYLVDITHLHELVRVAGFKGGDLDVFVIQYLVGSKQQKSIDKIQRTFQIEYNTQTKTLKISRSYQNFLSDKQQKNITQLTKSQQILQMKQFYRQLYDQSRVFNGYQFMNAKLVKYSLVSYSKFNNLQPYSKDNPQPAFAYIFRFYNPLSPFFNATYEFIEYQYFMVLYSVIRCNQIFTLSSTNSLFTQSPVRNISNIQGTFQGNIMLKYSQTLKTTQEISQWWLKRIYTKDPQTKSKNKSKPFSQMTQLIRFMIKVQQVDGDVRYMYYQSNALLSSFKELARTSGDIGDGIIGGLSSKLLTKIKTRNNNRRTSQKSKNEAKKSIQNKKASNINSSNKNNNVHSHRQQPTQQLEPNALKLTQYQFSRTHKTSPIINIYMDLRHFSTEYIPPEIVYSSVQLISIWSITYKQIYANSDIYRYLLYMRRVVQIPWALFKSTNFINNSNTSKGAKNMSNSQNNQKYLLCYELVFILNRTYQGQKYYFIVNSLNGEVSLSQLQKITIQKDRFDRIWDRNLFYNLYTRKSFPISRLNVNPFDKLMQNLNLWFFNYYGNSSAYNNSNNTHNVSVRVEQQKKSLIPLPTSQPYKIQLNLFQKLANLRSDSPNITIQSTQHNLIIYTLQGMIYNFSTPSPPQLSLPRISTDYLPNMFANIQEIQAIVMDKIGGLMNVQLEEFKLVRVTSRVSLKSYYDIIQVDFIRIKNNQTITKKLNKNQKQAAVTQILKTISFIQRLTLQIINSNVLLPSLPKSQAINSTKTGINGTQWQQDSQQQQLRLQQQEYTNFEQTGLQQEQMDISQYQEQQEQVLQDSLFDQLQEQINSSTITHPQTSILTTNLYKNISLIPLNYQIYPQNNQNHSQFNLTQDQVYQYRRTPSLETVSIVEKMFGQNAIIYAERLYPNSRIVGLKHRVYGDMNMYVSENQDSLYIEKIVYKSQGFCKTGNNYNQLRQIYQTKPETQIQAILHKMIGEIEPRMQVQGHKIGEQNLLVWRHSCLYSNSSTNVSLLQFYYDHGSTVYHLLVYIFQGNKEYATVNYSSKYNENDGIEQVQLKVKHIRQTLKTDKKTKEEKRASPQIKMIDLIKFDIIPKNIEHLKKQRQKLIKSKINQILNTKQYKIAQESLFKLYQLFLPPPFQVVYLRKTELQNQQINYIAVYQTKHSKFMAYFNYNQNTSKGSLLSFSVFSKQIDSLIQQNCINHSYAYDKCLQCQSQYILKDGLCYPKLVGCALQVDGICLICADTFVRKDYLCI